MQCALRVGRDGAIQAQDVTRRLIFYVPGFDPFPLRRYRELYPKEAKRQAALAGYQISQLPPDPALGADWGVDSVFEGQRTFAAFIVLGWSDLVKHAMSAGILRTYVALFQTLWIYLYSRAFFDLIQMRKGPVIAALYPVVMLLSQLFIALFTAWLVSLNFSSFWLSVPFASVIFIAILRGFKALDRIFFAYYLMQDFAFSAQLRGAYPAPLQQRINAFSARIEKALKENWDEILVVGHSSGAHIAISALAQIERSAAFDQAPATVGFLSLGQVIPMVAFLPNAGQLRRDLYDISRSTAIYWVDITAPGDGCSFSLCDPVAVSALPLAGQTGPLVLSAAFSQALSPRRWRRLRWRFFKLHFQYLCAFDETHHYDYFAITAGPITLRKRFCNRKPSKQVQKIAYNRYREIA